MSSSGWELVLKYSQPRTAIPAVVATFLLWRYVTYRIKSHVGKWVASLGSRDTHKRIAVRRSSIGPRFPGLAFISVIKALFKYDVVIEEGHRKVRHSAFIHSRPF